MSELPRSGKPDPAFQERLAQAREAIAQGEDTVAQFLAPSDGTMVEEHMESIRALRPDEADTEDPEIIDGPH